MDVLKVQLERIRQQLAGLSATQRMLAATLVAIMSFTLYYAVHFASTPDMSPVLDQSLGDADIAKIVQDLQSHGIPYSVSGGRVLVPTDRKMEAVAELMYATVLPHDSESAFEELNKELNPFSPPSERDDMRVEVTQREVAQIIRQWPDVADATVLINAKDKERIEGSIPPSATVSITMRDGSTVSKKLVMAAADSVVGAVSGLTRGQVSVIIDGVSHRLPDADNSTAGGDDDYMSLQQQNEARWEDKVRELFAADIPGLCVTVNCDVDNSSTSEDSQVYDGKATLVKEVESEDHTTDVTGSAAGGGEAGAGANTSASINGGGGGGGTTVSSSEDTTSKSQVFPGGTKKHIETPAGKAKVLSATVRVPRSHMIAVFKTSSPTVDPDEAAIQATATAELLKIRGDVKNCLGLDSDSALSVEMYADPSQSAMSAMAVAAAPSSSATSIAGVSRYAKEIAIGVLAVVSLFMMSNMVKKATPAPVIVPPPVEEETPILGGAEALAGEASFTNTTLDGMELDEDAVRNQQMLDQVTTMVKENPDGAAALVKRWLNRT
jgi:flagellar biosynthesis/type III secretory pathway M-ring protein FliF/YscJ